MKKLILLLFIPLVFTCSDDSSDDNFYVDPNAGENPVYLDSNGVTVKAKDWCNGGESGYINGIQYFVVSGSILPPPPYESNRRWCTTLITDMSYAFKNIDLNHNDWYEYEDAYFPGVREWDVSNVTDMRQMFYNTNALSQLSSGDIFSYWDVSNVTDMERMFARSPIAFNPDISSWDVSNVTDMFGMFYNECGFPGSYNQDLSGWDVSNVEFCGQFSGGQLNWDLPKPNFINCPDNANAQDSGCD